MATPVKTRVFENKAITLATTGDSTMVPCRGARAVAFLFTSSASEVFAAASAFAVQLRTETNESILTPADPGKHGVEVANAVDLNGAAANAGIIILVKPSDSMPCFLVKDIGCRVTAGAANMTDVDCYAFVVY